MSILDGSSAPDSPAPFSPAGERSARDQILDAALACFSHGGYDGTSLNDIVAGVGIRRPSLLHHFPSKEVLYGEVFERPLSDWFARLAGHRVTKTGWDKVDWCCGRASASSPTTPATSRLMRREAIDGGRT